MIKITTIESKLMIAFFSIASLVVIVGIVGIVNSLHIYTTLNVVANSILPELLTSNKIQSSVNKISSDVVGFAIVSPATKQLHQERLQQITQDSNTLTALVDKLYKAAPDSKDSAEPDYSMLKHLTSEYSTISLQLINSKYNGMNEQSILNLISSADNIRNEIGDIINKRINTQNTQIQNEIAKANDSIHAQQQEIIISSIVAFLMSLIIGRYISLNSIVKPLSKLKQATIQVAHGNFGYIEQKGSIPSQSNNDDYDEIGELSLQFDNMRQMLNQRTRELESSNKQLSLANEQLKVNDKLQRDFINIAAHELKTPVEPLLLGSEQLKDILPNNEIVSIVFRSAKKLQALSNTILDAARVESGTFKIYREHVNIKDIISDALEITNCCTASYNKSDNDYNINGLNIINEVKDIFIDADKDRITQVVSNLLNNSMKSIEEQEQQEEERVISVVTQIRENSELVVSVSDNGKGIDSEIMPRLFTKFATKSFDGTGLGLFISKSIVEAHGGKMWAENNTDGKKGATFSFSLSVVYHQY
ncbi:MAG TPA: HAMP domain-containing sensor histidine kinase [Nitrososphaeraceae archaeon]